MSRSKRKAWWMELLRRQLERPWQLNEKRCRRMCCQMQNRKPEPDWRESEAEQIG